MTGFRKPWVVKIRGILDWMKNLEFLPTVHYWMITEDPDQLWFSGNAGDHLSWWTHAHSFPACSSPHLELASAIPLLLRSISWEANSERGSSPQVGERKYSVFLSSKPTHVTSRVKKESKLKCYILKLFQPLFSLHTKEKKKPQLCFQLIIALANGYIFYEKT